VAGALALLSFGANAAIDDKKAQEIMNKAGCGACHHVDKKLVGPSYKEVAKKHKGQKDAAAVLVRRFAAAAPACTARFRCRPTPPARSTMRT